MRDSVRPAMISLYGISIVSANVSRHHYKTGFYVLASVVAAMLLLGTVILYATFERDPSYVVGRVIDRLSPEPSGSTLVFLPQYYYEDMDVLRYTYEASVRTLDDFYAWKDGPVLEQYRTRPTIHQVPHDYDAVYSEQRDGYTLSRFTMPTFYPDDIIFYKLEPAYETDAGHKDAAVLVIPGSGNQGVRDVLGEPSDISKYYYQDEMAKRLVLEGYDVYTLELHGYGEREIDMGGACGNESNYHRLTGCSASLLNNRLKSYGNSLTDIQTDEVTQVLAHMVYDQGVDRIAVVGLSLGAGHAASQAIINPDAVDAVVMASGLGSLADAPVTAQSEGRGQLVCCDTSDPIATIAPKPMYVSFGTGEIGIFKWEADTNTTGNFLGQVYSLHGAEGNFYYKVHDGIHGYHVESVIDFLSRHMG